MSFARYGHDEWAVPDAIRKFVSSFARQVKERNVVHITSSYQDHFVKLSERYFKASSWPTVDLIESIVDYDTTFLVLYKELYHRQMHLNRDLTPTLQDRIDSYDNFVQLFRILLDQSSTDPALILPNQWLWDIIEQFSLQFEEFHAFRGAVNELELDEVDILCAHPGTWNTAVVLRYLNALVAKGGLSLRLNANVDASTLSGVSEMARMSAYFALVSLANVNMLLASYQTALDVLAPIEGLRSSKRSVAAAIFSCFVRSHYIMGFCYLMLHRFDDTVKTFSTVLSHTSRINAAQGTTNAAGSATERQALPRTEVGVDTSQLCIERMQALLAMAHTISGTNLDENTLTALREEYDQEMSALENGSIETCQKMFTIGAPLFVSSALPNFEERMVVPAQLLHQQQMSLFIEEISQRHVLSNLDEFLKLYVTISLPKLADALNINNNTIINNLLALKNRSRSLHWAGDAPSNGVWQSSSNLTFYVTSDIVYVTYFKPPRQHRDFFLRNIHRLTELSDDILRIH